MPCRVLHVVGGMDRAGVETWLMNVLREIDRSAYQFDFLVHTEEPCSYDEEIRSLGGAIYPCPGPSNWVTYSRRFRSILKQYGPFDVVHSHVYLFSGLVMRIAAKAGVPIRIAHSHTVRKEPPFNLARISYAALMRHFNTRYATERVGVSSAAVKALFGTSLDAGCRVIPCGVDFTRFAGSRDSQSFKVRLGIPPDRRVIGHVGRFTPVKNHGFLLNIFEAVLRKRTDAHLLLVGDGPLMARVQDEVQRRNMSGHCTFAGMQTDVVPFIKAMDVFVFPSLLEGLGLSLLEAQAAGRSVVTSSVVPHEVDVISHLIHRHQLSERPEVWSATISELFDEGRQVSDEVLALQNSPFALPKCIDALQMLYMKSGSTKVGRLDEHERAVA